MPRFSITTPIFYVNAPPHIGHAYTVVAADVLARAHRLRGDDVFFLTGTDEHGAKIAEAAAAAGKSPQAFADEVAGTFTNAWNVLDVHYDDFIRTTEPRHVQGVRAALRLLHDSGHLYEKSYRGLYCTGCENFLTEKDLVVEKAPLRPLGSAGRRKCPLHNREPELVEENNWFFKLSTFADEVRALIERDELRINPVERKNEVLGLFKQGIADFSVSRPKERVPWAIPLPFDETQTCYVWVDALLNYVTALGYGSDDENKLKKWWSADLQIIGQDILKFHAVYWPALLLALDLPLPHEIFVHGFFTVNGQKISKSLGNTIDPLALMQRYGSDATRYLLLSQFPFGSSGDVQVARFDEQYDAVLANTIGNLVSRTVALLQKFSDSRVPRAERDRTVPFPALDWEAVGGVGGTIDGIVRTPVEFAARLNQYIDQEAPWRETDKRKLDRTLRTLADAVSHLGLLLEPSLPHAAQTIRRAFGVTGRQPAAPDTPIRPTDPPILFPRVQ